MLYLSGKQIPGLYLEEEHVPRLEHLLQAPLLLIPQRVDVGQVASGVGLHKGYGHDFRNG
jgi:hypothetical protein